MTLTSERAGLLLYSFLGTLVMLSWIYIPA